MINVKLMYKVIFSIGLLLFLAAPGFAQVFDDEDFGESPIKERVEAKRVAYITSRLNLTPEESTQFWPLHNEYESKKKALRRQYKATTPIKDMTNDQAEEYIMSRFEMEEKLTTLKRDYYQKFKAVISPKKIALFQKADNEFKRELLQRVREARQRRGQGGGFKR